MKQLFFLFLLLFVTHALPAQLTGCDTAMRQSESAIDIKHIKTSLDELKKQSKYNYNEAAPDLSITWFDRLKRKINDFFSTIFTKTVTGIYNQSLIVAFIGVLLLIVLLKVLGINIMNPFSKSGNDIPISYTSVQENIHGRNFEAEIDQAIMNKDTKLAIRLLFLKTLKQLTDQKLIEWMPNKTNQQYFYSLPASHQPGFSELTKIFEYAWYGEKNIEYADFQDIKNKFNSFII